MTKWERTPKKNPTPYNINGVKGKRWVCSTNEQWREERSHSIGASAIGILLGESHFTTPLQLAYKMRAELQGEFDYTETLAMMRGHAYESGVASLFEKITHKEIIQASAAEYLLRRDDTPFMHASPDRMFWMDAEGKKKGKNAELNKGILECKTTRMPIDGDNLPVSWIFQLQVQMGISGYHMGAIAWDVLSSANGFSFQFFDFDEDIYNVAVEVCRDFWEHCIINGEEPEPICGSDVTRLYPHHTVGKTLTVNRETTEAIAELKELKDAKRELEEAIEENTDKIKAQFTDEEAMLDIDGRVLCTFKTNSRGMRQLLIK